MSNDEMRRMKLRVAFGDSDIDKYRCVACGSTSIEKHGTVIRPMNELSSDPDQLDIEWYSAYCNNCEEVFEEEKAFYEPWELPLGAFVPKDQRI